MVAPMEFVRKATRDLFFTGKGGVGKTSLACATAVGLADRGQRVLLVSTDPASNLDEVLGVSVGSQPTAIPECAGAVCAEPGRRRGGCARTASSWSARIAACCPRRLSPAWKSSSPAPAPWKLRPSTSSHGCWAIRTRPPSSTTWYSTPRRPGIPCVCCRCPLRGVVLSTGTRAGLRASVRWPDCRIATSVVQGHGAGPVRPGSDNACVGDPRGTLGGSRGRSLQCRAGRHGCAESAPGGECRLRDARGGRSHRPGDGTARAGSTGCGSRCAGRVPP